jgi:hypothetical protein
MTKIDNNFQQTGSKHSMYLISDFLNFKKLGNIARNSFMHSSKEYDDSPFSSVILQFRK